MVCRSHHPTYYRSSSIPNFLSCPGSHWWRCIYHLLPSDDSQFCHQMHKLKVVCLLSLMPNLIISSAHEAASATSCLIDRPLTIIQCAAVPRSWAQVAQKPWLTAAGGLPGPKPIAPQPVPPGIEPHLHKVGSWGNLSATAEGQVPGDAGQPPLYTGPVVGEYDHGLSQELQLPRALPKPILNGHLSLAEPAEEADHLIPGLVNTPKRPSLRINKCTICRVSLFPASQMTIVSARLYVIFIDVMRCNCSQQAK